MNREELRRRLEREGIMKTAYSLGGADDGEQHVLRQAPGGKWSVYYSERGEKSGLRLFDTEHEACECLLDRILRDPTTREAN